MQQKNRPGASRRGFTILEVLMAAGVMVGGLLGLIAALHSASHLQRSTLERNRARAAIQDQIEQIYGTPWRDLVTKYGPGSPEAAFDVRGLSIVPGDITGQVGHIEIFLDETLDRPDLGLPRDLNGDGDALDTDVSEDKIYLMPFVVSVRWQGMASDLSLVVPTLYARR